MKAIANSYTRLVTSFFLALSLYSPVNMAYVLDTGFKACLEQLATQNNWGTPEDFIEITCHDREIKSVEGINLFLNVKKLSLFNNQLKSADVNGLKKLEHLNLAGNQLSYLTLQNLPNLRECFVFKNRLQRISIDNLPNLIKLKANVNQLVELNIVRVNKLEKLYLFNNQLKEISMTSLPVLSYFDARQNPMPDEFYDYLDSIENLTVLHDGNAEDWQ